MTRRQKKPTKRDVAKAIMSSDPPAPPIPIPPFPVDPRAVDRAVSAMCGFDPRTCERVRRGERLHSSAMHNIIASTYERFGVTVPK